MCFHDVVVAASPHYFFSKPFAKREGLWALAPRVLLSQHIAGAFAGIFSPLAGVVVPAVACWCVFTSRRVSCARMNPTGEGAGAWFAKVLG